MLTTQGLGDCEQVVNYTDQPGDPCGDRSCYSTGQTITIQIDSQTYTVPLYGIRTAVAYNKCGGYHPSRDCVHKIRNGQLQWQTCAEIELYVDENCMINWWGTKVEKARDFENIWGCPNSGGGGTVVGTSS